MLLLDTNPTTMQAQPMLQVWIEEGLYDARGVRRRPS